jgi:hypothetical protein
MTTYYWFAKKSTHFFFKEKMIGEGRVRWAYFQTYRTVFYLAEKTMKDCPEK